MRTRLDKSGILKILAWIMLLVAIATSAIAITGTSGNITVESISSSASSDVNMTGLHARFNTGWLFAGGFDAGGINGIFDINRTYLQTGIISLVLPLNNSGTRTENIIFRYTTSIDNVSACNLYIDGALMRSSTSITNGVNTFIMQSLAVGNHTWNVECRDIHSNITSSPIRVFKTIAEESFDQNSTDLNNVNIAAVPNFTLSVSGAGKIRFDGVTDLSGILDLDSHVLILQNSIVVDSTALPELNKHAQLTFENIQHSDIIILKDGAYCTTCVIDSFSGQRLVMNVTGFSNYTIIGTSGLYLYSDTDSNRLYKRDNITFYANLTNVTSGVSIAGTCNISFSTEGYTQTYDMTYDDSTLNFNYVTNFTSVGTYQFMVSCAPSVFGYGPITGFAAFTVSGDALGSFANVNLSVGNSSRFIESTGPNNVSANASQLSELVFDTKTITSAWQGYFGNVSGRVELLGIDNTSFYRWDLATVVGEVYASRSANVDWASIRCANMTTIRSEEAVAGMNSEDADSIDKTFSNRTAFSMFYTGSTSIDSNQDCYATRLYNYNAPSNYYSEILLSDNNNLVFTSILAQGVLGFDNNYHDFQMLVTENGHRGDTTITPYFFFLEIG